MCSCKRLIIVYAFSGSLISDQRGWYRANCYKFKQRHSSKPFPFFCSAATTSGVYKQCITHHLGKQPPTQFRKQGKVSWELEYCWHSIIIKIMLSSVYRVPFSCELMVHHTLSFVQLIMSSINMFSSKSFFMHTSLQAFTLTRPLCRAA